MLLWFEKNVLEKHKIIWSFHSSNLLMIPFRLFSIIFYLRADRRTQLCDVNLSGLNSHWGLWWNRCGVKWTAPKFSQFSYISNIPNESHRSRLSWSWSGLVGGDHKAHVTVYIRSWMLLQLACLRWRSAAMLHMGCRWWAFTEDLAGNCKQVSRVEEAVAVGLWSPPPLWRGPAVQVGTKVNSSASRRYRFSKPPVQTALGSHPLLPVLSQWWVTSWSENHKQRFGISDLSRPDKEIWLFWCEVWAAPGASEEFGL